MSLLLAAPAVARALTHPPVPYQRWTLDDPGSPISTRADRALPPADTTVRFVVPEAWRRTNSSTARYRFDDGRPHDGCWMSITVFDRVAIGAATSPTARLRVGLPARSAAYVLDEGTRDGAAWRVVRQPGGAAVHGRYAIRSTRLEKLLGTDAPAVWHEVEVVTTPHGECHSGRYQAMGDQVGDLLASLDREAVPTADG